MEPQRPLANAPGAVTALVLGILGLVICPICAPFAWHYGVEAEKHARTGKYTGGGLATAGKVLGIIGSVFLAIGIVVLFAVATTSDSLETGGWTAGGR